MNIMGNPGNLLRSVWGRWKTIELIFTQIFKNPLYHNKLLKVLNWKCVPREVESRDFGWSAAGMPAKPAIQAE